MVFFSARETDKTHKPQAIQQLLSRAQGRKGLREADLFLQVILHQHKPTNCPCVKLSLDYYCYLYTCQGEIFRCPNRSKLWAPISATQWYRWPWKIHHENFKIKPQISDTDADPWSQVLRLFNNVLWKYKVLAVSEVQYYLQIPLACGSSRERQCTQITLWREACDFKAQIITKDEFSKVLFITSCKCSWHSLKQFRRASYEKCQNKVIIFL